MKIEISGEIMKVVRFFKHLIWCSREGWSPHDDMKKTLVEGVKTFCKKKLGVIRSVSVGMKRDSCERAVVPMVHWHSLSHIKFHFFL